MPVKILIPTALRAYTDKQREVEVEGATVAQAIANLVERHPELSRHLFDDPFVPCAGGVAAEHGSGLPVAARGTNGRLRSFVSVFVGDQDMRGLKGMDTPLRGGDTVSIVPSVAGGTSSPRRPPSGNPRSTASTLSREEILRYSRHLIMPEVGLEGQEKLKSARVLCVGAGGLGAPASLYLTAAGVGTLGLVDFDAVDYSNLQRQVLFSHKDVGRPKLHAAAERLNGMNPHVAIVPHETRLTSENALGIIEQYDYVVDGTDNFPTRYLVNDACVLIGRTNVYASIFRFEGQVSVFGHRAAGERGPCYRCVYPDPPPPGLVPSCAEGGVLGVLPGIVGSLQALECIKLIIGQGEPLVGRLLLFDALEQSFRVMKIRRDLACPVCGDSPTVSALIDYEQFCGVAPAGAPSGGGAPGAPSGDDDYQRWQISAPELKKALAERPGELRVIDVREPHEWSICHIEGAELMPMSEFPRRLKELDSSREIVLHCHLGGRSMKALHFLRECGFSKVRNLDGGIDAWAELVEPDMPRY